MLELEDIQLITMTRVPAVTGRYEFLSFREPAEGRAWLAGILDKVASAKEASAFIEKENRWVSVAFTWAGLGALGIDKHFSCDLSGGIPSGHGRTRADAR